LSNEKLQLLLKNCNTIYYLEEELVRLWIMSFLFSSRVIRVWLCVTDIIG